MAKETADWRNHAKPEEVELHDQLIEVAHENAAYRRLIRNRCRMRGLAKHDSAVRDLGGGQLALRGGKKRAGRLLDGVQHDGFPK